MAYIDPRSVKQLVVTFNSYPNGQNRCETEVVGKQSIDLGEYTGPRESLFRKHADSVLPLVDKSNSEYRHEVRTHLGMTQVLSALIIRQPNGNYWKVAHYS